MHRKVRNGKAGHLIVFVVDASGSMAAGKRMEAVKGSVMGLLQNAYQKRDMVAVIAFQGAEAMVLLEPTRSTELAEQALIAIANRRAYTAATRIATRRNNGKARDVSRATAAFRGSSDGREGECTAGRGW